LVPIDDPEALRELKGHFDKNFSKKYKTMQPIICGSVVHRIAGQDSFSRKLKMVNANLFTLLSISGSDGFVKDHK
jgi:hypothetical protein